MIQDELFEAGFDLRSEMFGEGPTRTQLEGTTELDEKLQDIVTRYCFGDIWQREGLTARERSLITVGILAATDRSTELRIHMRGALANGASETELREVALHSILYCGIPTGVEAIRALREVIDSSGHGDAPSLDPTRAA